ncbi:MAG: hypothetical protein EA416_12645 [Trueperaceae bacterium]|nr:MAG: hypothetical protein EA416_12645 [Trueperaceae bacterium]
MGGPPDALHARLLGALSFVWRDEPVMPASRKSAWLLALVATRRDGVRRTELAELLWSPGRLGSVRQALHVLRTLPGADAWLDAGDPVRVRAWTDLQAFEQACDDDRYGDALAAWHGPLLADDDLDTAPAPFGEWLELERARLEQRRSWALHAHLRALRSRDEHAAAFDLARAELAVDPFDESLHRAAIGAAAALGRHDDALQQFEACRNLLRDELGVEPLPETLALLAEIERGAAARAPVARLLRGDEHLSDAPAALVGRDALVSELEARVDAGERVLLHGLGGVGKTALAATVASRLASRMPCVWLALGDLTPDSAFDAIVRALQEDDAPARSNPDAHASRAMASAELRLLVVDDAHNAYAVARVRDALPPTTALVVTSRSRYPGLARVHVPPLDRSASLELLHQTWGAVQRPADERGAAPSREPTLDDTEAGALCDLLGDHPFAIRLAAATMAAEGSSPGMLRARIAAVPHTLEAPDGDGGLTSVASLIESSLESLPDDAHEAYLAIGALPAASTTPELLAHLVRRHASEVDEALIGLAHRGLAWREAEPGVDLVRYRMHDLAHSHARAATPLRPTSVVRAALAYLADRPVDAAAQAAERANLVGAVRIAARAGDHAAAVRLMAALTREGALYTAHGLGAEGEALVSEAADAAETLGDHGARARLLGRLGDHRFSARGDTEGALRAYLSALEAASVALDAERMAVTSSLVGITKLRLGHDDATQHLDAALRHAEASLDPLCLSTIQEQRGFAAAEADAWEEARTWILASLATLTSVEADPRAGPEHAREPEALKRRFFGLMNLGEVELQLGDAAASQASRESALALACDHDNELWEAIALHELGGLHHRAGRREEARRALARALDLYRLHDVSAEAAEVAEFVAEHGYAPA